MSWTQKEISMAEMRKQNKNWKNVLIWRFSNKFSYSSIVDLHLRRPFMKSIRMINVCCCVLIFENIDVSVMFSRLITFKYTIVKDYAF